MEIVARSMCMLRPGIPGLSENVHVRSIAGRYLEHSRLFSFEADGRHELFLGSADLMPRNLDRRVEVVVPLEGQRLRQEAAAVLASAFADNTNAWELRADAAWERIVPAKGEKAHDHQANLRRRAQVRARRASSARTRSR